jgi:hypothetical protein
MFMSLKALIGLEKLWHTIIQIKCSYFIKFGHNKKKGSTTHYPIGSFLYKIYSLPYRVISCCCAQILVSYRVVDSLPYREIIQRIYEWFGIRHISPLLGITSRGCIVLINLIYLQHKCPYRVRSKYK